MILDTNYLLPASIPTADPSQLESAGVLREVAGIAGYDYLNEIKTSDVEFISSLNVHPWGGCTRMVVPMDDRVLLLTIPEKYRYTGMPVLLVDFAFAADYEADPQSYDQFHNDGLSPNTFKHVRQIKKIIELLLANSNATIFLLASTDERFDMYSKFAEWFPDAGMRLQVA